MIKIVKDIHKEGYLYSSEADIEKGIAVTCSGDMVGYVGRAPHVGVHAVALHFIDGRQSAYYDSLDCMISSRAYNSFYQIIK